MYKKTVDLIVNYVNEMSCQFDCWDWPMQFGPKCETMSCMPRPDLEDFFDDDTIKDAQAYDDMVNQSVLFCIDRTKSAMRSLQNENYGEALSELMLALEEEKLYREDNECAFSGPVSLFKKLVEVSPSIKKKDLHSLVDSFIQESYNK